MLVWLTLPFYDFCGFRSVAVNSVYKLQFFTFMLSIGQVNLFLLYVGYGLSVKRVSLFIYHVYLQISNKGPNMPLTCY